PGSRRMVGRRMPGNGPVGGVMGCTGGTPSGTHSWHALDNQDSCFVLPAPSDRLMNSVSPRQLGLLVAIAGDGSLHGAAEQLPLPEPAASMALRELQRLLGCRVFDRIQQRLHLNAHGRRLLPRARDILERLREFGLGDAGEDLSGELRLGASNTIGNY